MFTNSLLEFASGDLVTGGIRLGEPLNNTANPPTRGATIVPWANDRSDLKAPGVRDQYPNPTMVYLGPFRSHIFDTGRTVNNAPINTWFDSADNVNWLATDWNRRRSAYLYDVCRETKDVLHPAFQERGSFVVPKTGFSAFGDLKAASTRTFI